MVLVVLRISMHVFWIFVLCLWSDQFEFVALFMGFNLWIGPGLFLSLVVNFSMSIFLVQ